MLLQMVLCPLMDLHPQTDSACAQAEMGWWGNVPGDGLQAAAETQVQGQKSAPASHRLCITPTTRPVPGW